MADVINDLRSGSVQRLHGEEVDVSDLHWSNVLSASEAHGGRQDPLEGPGPRPDPQQTANGGTVTVRDTSACLSQIAVDCAYLLITISLVCPQ